VRISVLKKKANIVFGGLTSTTIPFEEASPF
jgi:hypothetical protein